MGTTLLWLSLIVLIPLAALFFKTTDLSARAVPAHRHQPARSTRSSCRSGCRWLRPWSTSFGSAVAWALVRYEFPGRRVFDAMVDIPFALPTAVAGIALTTLYGERMARPDLAPLGIQVAFLRWEFSSRWCSLACRSSVRTGAAGPRGPGGRAGGGGGDLGCLALDHHSPRHLSRPPCLRFLTGFRARLRPRGGRIRISHLHRRQPAERVGDRTAPDRHPPGGVPLCGCHRHRRGDAGRIVSHSARDQPAAALVRAAYFQENR